jgi:hypothetical protein
MMFSFQDMALHEFRTVLYGVLNIYQYISKYTPLRYLEKSEVQNCTEFYRTRVVGSNVRNTGLKIWSLRSIRIKKNTCSAWAGIVFFVVYCII